MKISFKYFFLIAFAAVMFSCKKDNYDPPSSTLSGQLMYQGDSIQIERNQVQLQLYQFGFGRVGPIEETFTQNGTFSAMLFDGDYKLIIPNGQGPFMWKQTVAGTPDSISISLKGSQSVNLEVTPYYMIRTPKVAAAGADSVSATCKIDKIITDANAKDVDFVAIYVNTTQFVAGSNNIASATLAGTSIADMNNVQLGVKFTKPAQNYVFARIGVKIAGVEDLLFSPLFTVQL